jgi:hypothetical protein
MTHEFSSSAERLFAALDDHANMGRWLGAKIELIHAVPDGGVGSVRRMHLGVQTIDEEIIERVVPTLIVYKIVRGLFPLDRHRGEVRVTVLSSSSARAEWQIEIGSKIPFLASIVGFVLKTAIHKGLARLDKQLASA